MFINSFSFFKELFRNIWNVKKSQQFLFFFIFSLYPRIPPGSGSGSAWSFCPDPDPQKKCGSETLIWWHTDERADVFNFYLPIIGNTIYWQRSLALQNKTKLISKQWKWILSRKSMPRFICMYGWGWFLLTWGESLHELGKMKSDAAKNLENT